MTQKIYCYFGHISPALISEEALIKRSCDNFEIKYKEIKYDCLFVSLWNEVELNLLNSLRYHNKLSKLTFKKKFLLHESNTRGSHF